MNRFLFFLSCYLFFGSIAAAQISTDSTISRDSLSEEKKILVHKTPVQDSAMTLNPAIPFSSTWLTWQLLQRNPYVGFTVKASPGEKDDIKQFDGKELLFYPLVFIVILYALLRLAFPKYFTDLFRLFFRTTLNQRQIREQLIQTPLPSLLLNGFFIISSGLYISLLLKHFNIRQEENFWTLFFYSCAGLSVAYFIKFTGLKISGWLFNMKEAANAYIFIVFIVNKMIGIFLLPFLVILAFGTGYVYSVGLALSWGLIAGMIVYRLILTYIAIRNQVKVNPFHFFLYLCAFEIAPLLLVYKGLLLFFSRTT